MERDKLLQPLLEPGQTAIVFLGQRYRLSGNKLYSVLSGYYKKTQFIQASSCSSAQLKKLTIKRSEVPLIISLDLHRTHPRVLEFLLKNQVRKKIIIVNCEETEFSQHLMQLPLPSASLGMFYKVIDVVSLNFTFEHLSLFRIDPITYTQKFIHADQATRYVCYESLRGEDLKALIKMIKRQSQP